MVFCMCLLFIQNQFSFQRQNTRIKKDLICQQEIAYKLLHLFLQLIDYQYVNKIKIGFMLSCVNPVLAI